MASTTIPATTPIAITPPVSIPPLLFEFEFTPPLGPEPSSVGFPGGNVGVLDDTGGETRDGGGGEIDAGGDGLGGLEAGGSLGGGGLEARGSLGGGGEVSL